MARLTVSVLGELSISVGKAPLLHTRTQKDVWLLALLALQKQGAMDRRSIAFTLWPDLAETNSLDNLRHSLWRIRRVLGESADHISTNSHSVSLSPETDVDVWKFERLANSDSLSANLAALDLWRGEPLCGIDQDWAEVARAPLQALYRSLLGKVVDQLMLLGRGEDAVRYARTLSIEEPYSDTCTLRLIEALFSTGRSNEAKTQYERFERILVEDLDAHPEIETRIRYLALSKVASQGQYARSFEHWLHPMCPTMSASALSHWRRGEMLHRLARYDDALYAFETCATCCRADGDISGLISVLAQAGRVHADRGTATKGLALLAPWVNECQEEVPHVAMASLYAAQAILLHCTGAYADQLRASKSAVRLAEAANAKSILAEATGYLGLAYINLATFARAEAVLERTITLAQAPSDWITLSSALTNLAWVGEARGNFELSVGNLVAALGLAQHTQDPSQVSFVAQSLARNCFFLGQWREAHSYLDLSDAALSTVTASWASPYAPLERGRLLLAQGNLVSAVSKLDDATKLALELGDVQAMRSSQRLLAMGDLLHGHPSSARERLEPLLESGGLHEVDVTFVLPVLALACQGTRDTHLAWSLATDAVDRARTENNVRGLIEALRSRASIATERGKLLMADKSDVEAQNLARTYGYRYALATGVR